MPPDTDSQGADSLLDIRGLTIDVRSGGRQLRLVDALDMSIDRGQRVALVGESGSGKSVTALAVLRLIRGTQLGGRVYFDGVDLLTLSERRMRAVRGARISMVFQDPLASLNPVMSVGDQVAETLIIRGTGRREARARAGEVLDELGVPVTGKRLDAYPHELSGGMRQRVMLAMAVLPEPDLLIADEPTTALDVRVQDQVMDLMDNLATSRGMAVLLITHDLGIVAGFADRVAVMYAGNIVEEAQTDVLFAAPAHPYTQGLLASVPRVDEDLSTRLTTIDGAPPVPADRPSGCPFHPRCPAATDVCRQDMPLRRVLHPAGGTAACHHAPVDTVEEPTSG